jgi:hypothetical protein
MLEEIKQEIATELKKVRLLDYAPDMKGVEEILQLKGRNLSTLSETKLSEYVFTITQYQLYLQLHHNIRNIEYLTAEGEYERAVDKALIGLPDKKQTVKEKIATAIETNPHIKELLVKMEKARNRHILFNKIPDAFIEWGNAIKKELSIRTSKKDVGYKKQYE